tara:strand:+ start:2394 stop:2495 length:102 start_codon:yes stop_codon:yes gene_type:complete
MQTPPIIPLLFDIDISSFSVNLTEEFGQTQAGL